MIINGPTAEISDDSLQRLKQLSRQEELVLMCTAYADNYRCVASQLDLALPTVKKYLSQVKEKLRVAHVREAIVLAARHQVIPEYPDYLAIVELEATKRLAIRVLQHR